MGRRAETTADVPLVVDMDGTLIKVDSLHEAFVQLSAQKPLYALRAVLRLRQGRAAFKAAIADHVRLDAGTMPVEESVLEAVKQARGKGRKVYLATAADRRFAEVIANSIAEFDGIFASENGINLKGQTKADCIIAAFGMHGFDYIGNDAADIPVWRAARTALISGATPRLLQELRAEIPALVTLNLRQPTIGAYIRALRPDHWLKNVLVALPSIATHDFSINGLRAVLIAFASFSLAASSVYLVNDMLDLPYDRTHPEKRHRSLAAGLVPLSHAVGLLGLVTALSAALALLLPWPFMLVLIAYFGLAMSYSLYLKRKPLVDVVALTGLYGSRVLAGCAATGIALSPWLVGFCFFIFLSLALVKRKAEITAVPGTGISEDLRNIPTLAAACGVLAVLVLALYINSPEVGVLYRNPKLLWGACIILVYWLGRIYLLTGRGEMRQDPVVFAGTDWVSLAVGVLIVAVFLAAL